MNTDIQGSMDAPCQAPAPTSEEWLRRVDFWGQRQLNAVLHLAQQHDQLVALMQVGAPRSTSGACDKEMPLESANALSSLSSRGVKDMNNTTASLNSISNWTKPLAQIMRQSPEDDKMEHLVSAARSMAKDESALKEMLSSSRKSRISKNDSQCVFVRIAQAVVSRPYFDGMCGVLVIMSAILVGVEVDILAAQDSRDEGPLGLFLSQAVLNAFFLVELIIRVLAAGLHGFFWTSSDRSMNYFDTAMVGLSVVDVVGDIVRRQGVTALGPAVSQSIRALRVMRVLRTLRVTRALRQFRDFRKMMYALQASSSTFVWSLAILTFTMYTFAIIFTMASTEHLKGSTAAHHVSLVKLSRDYGTLGDTLYTLFRAISNGESWGLVANPLRSVHWTMFVFFLLFMCLMLFGVLNVVTSVFVDAAMKSTERYKDLLMSEQEREKEIKLRHIKQVFNQMDEDGSGNLSLLEMEYFLADDDLRKYLEALDISAHDTRCLFKLIDTDGSNIVSIEEFCDGCMRLRGPAKSLDIHYIIAETRRLTQRWVDCFAYLERRFEEIHRHISKQTKSMEHAMVRERSTRMSLHSSLCLSSGDVVDGVTRRSSTESFLASDTEADDLRSKVLGEECLIPSSANSLFFGVMGTSHPQP